MKESAEKNLDTFFYVFFYSFCNCQSWDDTVNRCRELGLTHVPVLYRGIWDEDIIRGLASEYYEGNEMEGYVVRVAGKFKGAFTQGKEWWLKEIAKYVRAGHVQTDEHWKKKPVVWNDWKR